MRKSHGQVVALALGLLLVWQALCMSEGWPPEVLPAPSDVAVAAWRMTWSGEFFASVWMTLRRVAAGYLLALVAGGGLGIALARYGRLASVAGPVVRGLEALPAICWYPLALIWFGAGEWMLLWVTAVGPFFAVASATDEAIRAIPHAFVKAAATLGAGGWSMYMRVMFPASLPRVLVGLRVGWSYAWRSLLAAELLVRGVGLGDLLDRGGAAETVAAMLVVLGLGLVVERFGFEPVEHRVRLRWGA
ncbi:MAG: transporter permease protein [Symbiobacteriaceae bacterium]|jgi:NitT/TauT family transport system permease protein|nr:transporter permease protein [Symbiobacteriaceae bacterium]